FRRRVSEIINSESRLEVIDVAVNGREAVEKAKSLKPDVITMDIEMPVMDGITAVREIMAAAPTPILMFSSLTHDGAKATLDALDAGALDFLPKKFEDIARNREEAVSLLQQRVIQIASKRAFMRRPIARPTASTSTTTRSLGSRTASAVTPTPTRPAATKYRASGKKYQLTAIGTSTGGPVALQKILTRLPMNYPHPIVLIQHMPATFTAAFASRLNTLCKIQVKEAQDGDVLQPGVAYLAPGGKQMMVD
ncbi:chemotaxis-specific protein-glutamate methyltransferase CheB, partial [Vibrio parahaemolyticus]|nr:chemotaxis-specific protein-glutamate methyltransferase CheB [Vibrio parahaemolyticus]